MHTLTVICLLLAQADDAESEDQPPKAYAAKFSGQSYIKVEDSVEVVDLNSDFTIEMWVRWDRTANAVFCGNSAWPSMALRRKPRPGDVEGEKTEVTDECGWGIRGEIVKRRAKISFDAGAENMQWSSIEGAVSPRTPAWMHVAICRRKDDLFLFIHGKRVAKKSVKGQNFLPSPMPLHLGPPPYTNLESTFDGSIRGFCISSTCRHDADFIPTDDWPNDDDTRLLFDFLDVELGSETTVDDSVSDRRGVCVGVNLVERQVALPEPTQRKPAQN